MTRQRYRGNTLSAAFPLLSSFSGQSVIVPGIDQFYYRPNAISSSEADKNYGIPQAIFMENVMPMTNGLQSVGFSQAVASGPGADFDQAFYLRDTESRYTLFVPAQGRNYTYDAPIFLWRTQQMSTPFGALVTCANIKNRQFVCYAKHSIFFEWNGESLIPVDLVGLDATAVLGIVAAGAYLIAFTENEIFWSSLTDPTDFVPSLATGAGGTDVLSLKGDIVTCTPLSDGFNIYTSSNITVASYTGNVRFPWTFKELAGAAGIDDPEKVINNNSAVNQYAFTVSGLMEMNRSVCAQVWPEVSEFISGRRYEVYNYDTHEIEEVNTNNALLTKVNFIAERYLVISYGDNKLTHALIYDTGLKRWGKIAIDHVDTFDFRAHPTMIVLGTGQRYQDLVGPYQDQNIQYYKYGHLNLGFIVGYRDLIGSYAGQWQRYNEYGPGPLPGVFIDTGQEPYKNIGFLQATGTVKVINFDLPLEAENSVLFLGRYQLTRGRFTDLYELWIENASSTCTLAVLPSFDGFNYEAPVLQKRDKKVCDLGRLQKFFCNHSAMSFAIRLEGSFDLNSIEAVFGVAGYR